jgi:hypothetical protein
MAGALCKFFTGKEPVSCEPQVNVLAVVYRIEREELVSGADLGHAPIGIKMGDKRIRLVR